MKYIILENNEKEEDELLYDIADFFWNNGNEVYIRNKNNKTVHQDIFENSYCIVLLIYSDCREKHLFEKDLEKLYQDYELENSPNKRTTLVFSKNGVFSDIIPFPHKIFEFNKLDRVEFVRFFNWCRKLNLFYKQVN